MSYEVNQDLLHSTRLLWRLRCRIYVRTKSPSASWRYLYQLNHFTYLDLFILYLVSICCYTMFILMVEGYIRIKRPTVYFLQNITILLALESEPRNLKLNSQFSSTSTISIFLLYCFVSLSDPISVVWWLFEERERERERERQVRRVNQPQYSQCTAQNWGPQLEA